ncbi:ImmA/IrrE family metallo-endopeptidase [Yersinia enterocolitica]|uniref:ImmA/IrrE family metallo-endopeptidase n=1 Tax=Yersinia enterocolitica TaxID=630 RepID=UPI00022DD303|nr:ImmA/IrrE family metallo-endopeptidase [Yersinia enterocolitica]EHB20278.1 hypothetical protein IOK_13933 [Yersinia enterocolitica subsp. palearctica PhRBD_Ye1]EKN3316230.1 ImmA/IrrE family metallo-endopeptidase [Yersinia enterocolitica]EKN3324080.1 ImmA/IrrE family metallo-endopeptidase [Yersinia enterocolitica]EKN3331152.1 ImmA/IrrE family metallo-endopeptidase [Yersinia enterocolitica]EKN3336048.1 ImmA/IrrE family metallo-endopeptidase [Yersinia enterocolitica]
MAFIRKKPKEAKNHSADIERLVTPSELLNFAKNNNICLEPIDVSALTQLLGIIMRLEPMPGDESGSLKKDKTGAWIMTVNSLHHPHRQRFTIAHEIGHYIKHTMLSNSFEDKVFFRNGEMNNMETEANRFAAELLMPEHEFHQFIGNGSQTVTEIADYFHVSSMAVRIRAQQLGYDGHNL